MGHDDITIISSPGYYSGTPYPVLQNCLWENITVPSSSHVWISFNQKFAVEYSANYCPPPSFCCDYVEIYDGPPTTDYLIGR